MAMSSRRDLRVREMIVVFAELLLYIYLIYIYILSIYIYNIGNLLLHHSPALCTPSTAGCTSLYVSKYIVALVASKVLTSPANTFLLSSASHIRD